ncbi:MAG TPA: hypothetical protein EYP89_03395 [Candidatus Omnitrophica bacterium]|nr:hypothetical protein [Candidatus Omnitrophota bacterium]
MKYLFKENLNRKFKKAKHLFLFLDYDGTLTSIVKTPSQAKISSSTKEILSSLAKKKKIILGIISGRSLENIKKKMRQIGKVEVPQQAFLAVLKLND